MNINNYHSPDCDVIRINPYATLCGSFLEGGGNTENFEYGPVYLEDAWGN